MTAHELAKKLLEGPDVVVVEPRDSGAWSLPRHDEVLSLVYTNDVQYSDADCEIQTADVVVMSII